MREITPSLKKRFCKDNNIPIAVFDEPYFSERLKTIDRIIPCTDAWEIFIKEIKQFNTDQDYFEYYNSVKENVIQHLKINPAYQKFNEGSEVQEAIRNIPQLPKKNLYVEQHDNLKFVSIDMRKANFTALHYYNPDIFDKCNTWEEFLSKFTDLEHIIKSKYIRQVIMGALNPKRQTGHEKVLMNKLLQEILRIEPVLQDQLLSVSNDEIIFYAPYEASINQFGRTVEDLCGEIIHNNATYKNMYRIEPFLLRKIPFADGYERLDCNSYDFKLKGVDAEIFHQVAKRMLGLEITDNDLVFRHNHRLAKFLEPVV